MVVGVMGYCVCMCLHMYEFDYCSRCVKLSESKACLCVVRFFVGLGFL